MRLGTVAKDGAIQALAESRPGVAAARRDMELEAARAEAARLGEAVRELAVKLVLVEGKGRWAEWPGPAQGGSGHQGRAAELLEQVCGQGWTVRAACQVLQVNELRVYRWLHRRAAVSSRTGRRVASRCTACWTGRSRRSSGCSMSGRARPFPHQARPPRLASGAGVGLARQRAPRAGAPGPAVAAAAAAGPVGPQAVPDWVDYRPGSMWIYDTTQFTHAGVAATVSRTWSRASGWPRSSRPRRLDPGPGGVHPGAGA
jgi:hypothetical protein